MASPAILAAAAAAVLLLLLALRLRGPRDRRDLTGPPHPKRRRIGTGEAKRLVELVERGEQGEALRLMREWASATRTAARCSASSSEWRR